MSWAAGYTGWDAHKIQQCTCDPGWEGTSCSSRMCPKGDDPLTTGQVPTTIFLGTGRFAGADASTTATATRPGFQSADTTPVLVPGLEFVLDYTDSFNNKFYTSAISGVDTSAIEIEEALERGFIVEVDLAVRKLKGLPALKGRELELQRVVW